MQEDTDTTGDQKAEEREEAKEEVKRLEEEGPPDKLEDWPSGAAKYETFGGPEGEHGYHEGPEEKMGPADVRHRDDGSVEVGGEKADDPDEYKGEPIEGGPTDPNTPNLRMDKASPEGGEGDDDAADDSDDGQDGQDGEERSD